MGYSFAIEASEISDYHADMLDMQADNYQDWIDSMEESASEDKFDQFDQITLADVNGAGVYAGGYQPSMADYGYFWDD